jgi:hypothetical protein
MSPFHQPTARGVAAMILIAGLIGSAAAVVFAGSAPEAGATSPPPFPAPVVSGGTATVTCVHGSGPKLDRTCSGHPGHVRRLRAQGGGGAPGQGGTGGEANATLGVTPGSALIVAVGESGGPIGRFNGGAYGGGGAAGPEGGGGTSTVSDGHSTLIVADGGEGFSKPGTQLLFYDGGHGGGTTGTSGQGSLGGAPGRTGEWGTRITVSGTGFVVGAGS